MSHRLSVNFEGSLLQLKEWLAEMPDNLAGVLYTSFKAETQGAKPQIEEVCRSAALEMLQSNQYIAAIKAVRVACACAGHTGFLSTLPGAKAFVGVLQQELTKR